MPLSLDASGGLRLERGDRASGTERYLTLAAPASGVQWMRIMVNGAQLAAFGFSGAEATALGNALAAGTGTGP